MSEEPTQYRAKPSAEQARAILEAQALRHVFQLAEADRPEALDKLNRAALALGGLLRDVAADLKAAPALALPDLWEKIHKDPKLAKGAAAVLDPTKGIAPEDAAAAYDRALEEYAQGIDLRRIEAARRFLDEAEAAKDNPKARAVALDNAFALVDRAQEEEKAAQPLSVGWKEHRASLKESEAGPLEAVKLDDKRGPWAAWVNSWLGPRAGLMPGKSLLLGGAAGGGKTSLASVFAWDALAAGCPVLLYQLELGRFSAVEYLLHQDPAPDVWKQEPMARLQRDLPQEWDRLLEVPRDASPRPADALEALKRFAKKAARARKDDAARHACNGLVVVDLSLIHI